MTAETKYPECEKLAAVADKSQAIGDFLGWLQSGEADNTRFKRPVSLAAVGIVAEHWHKGQQTLLEEDECHLDGEGELSYWHYSTEKLLAKYFEIDLDKVEFERRAMLEELRKKDTK